MRDGESWVRRLRDCEGEVEGRGGSVERALFCGWGGGLVMVVREDGLVEKLLPLLGRDPV